MASGCATGKATALQVRLLQPGPWSLGSGLASLGYVRVSFQEMLREVLHPPKRRKSVSMGEAGLLKH